MKHSLGIVFCVTGLIIQTSTSAVDAQDPPPYVRRYVPLPFDEIRSAVDGMNQRAEGNEAQLMLLLEWVYQVKPLAVDDPTLFGELEEYQAILEELQTGAMSQIGGALLEVENGIKRTISNAEVRAAGGAPGEPADILLQRRLREESSDRQRRIEQGWLDLQEDILTNHAVFEERFHDNGAGWQTTAEGGETVSMRRSAYTVGVTDRNRWHFFVPASVPRFAWGSNSYAIAIGLSRIENREADDGAVLGLIWGWEDNENYNAFLIDPDHRALALIRTRNGRGEALYEGVGFTGNGWRLERSGVEAIRQGSLENRLGITMSNGSFVFTINGVIVAATDDASLHGQDVGIPDLVGIWVGGRQTVRASIVLIGARSQ